MRQSVPSSNLRVLVVEDSFETMQLIKNMLHDIGMTQVFTAKNGTEALALLNAYDDDESFVDVILSDWKMPGMSGIDLLRQVRTCDEEIPFLLITGTADRGSVIEAKACGVTGYIRKPFSSAQLESKMRVVSRILEHRKQD
ncbi:MAG: response regulator [Alphaproteobacteria bacterium]